VPWLESRIEDWGVMKSGEQEALGRHLRGCVGMQEKGLGAKCRAEELDADERLEATLREGCIGQGSERCNSSTNCRNAVKFLSFALFASVFIVSRPLICKAPFSYIPTVTAYQYKVHLKVK